MRSLRRRRKRSPSRSPPPRTMVATARAPGQTTATVRAARARARLLTARRGVTLWWPARPRARTRATATTATRAAGTQLTACWCARTRAHSRLSWLTSTGHLTLWPSCARPFTCVRVRVRAQQLEFPESSRVISAIVHYCYTDELVEPDAEVSGLTATPPDAHAPPRRLTCAVGSRRRSVSPQHLLRLFLVAHKYGLSQLRGARRGLAVVRRVPLGDHRAAPPTLSPTQTRLRATCRCRRSCTGAR